jgi:hypothetical protein
MMKVAGPCHLPSGLAIKPQLLTYFLTGIKMGKESHAADGDSGSRHMPV